MKKQELEQEIKDRKSKLSSNIEENLNSTENKLATKVKNKTKDLKENIADLEKKKEELVIKRKESIQQVINQLGAEKEVDTILTDYQNNLAKIDLSDEVIEGIQMGGD